MHLGGVGEDVEVEIYGVDFVWVWCVVFSVLGLGLGGLVISLVIETNLKFKLSSVVA